MNKFIAFMKMDIKDVFKNKWRERYEKASEDHLKTLHEFKRFAENAKAVAAVNSLREYIAIKEFKTGERDFIRKIAAIQESEEMKFMLHDLKQQCVENMASGNVEVNQQMIGVLKGIDLVIKNLNGYKNAWDSIVKEEAKNAGV